MERAVRTRIDNVRSVRWVNFKGENRNGNNRSGKKSFAAFLYPEDAERLRRDGWPVKEWVNKYDPDAQPEPYIDIKVNFHVNPRTGQLEPHVFSCVNKKAVPLDEEMAKELDDDVIVDAHLVINPYYSTVQGQEYLSAYLNTGYFDIDPESNREYTYEDPFANMYK